MERQSSPRRLSKRRVQKKHEPTTLENLAVKEERCSQECWDGRTQEIETCFLARAVTDDVGQDQDQGTR
jgi:hypothetical protein